MTRSAARGRSSRSASRGAAPGRNGPRARRSRLRRAGFEKIGAVGWAEQARAGARQRSADARAVTGLSPAEQRVADLVAKGRTNAEVAAALFLSERTVASHLTRVYAKLGVRSRTELARKLG